LYDHGQRSNWIGGVRHDEFRRNPELDASECSHYLHDQQLHRVAERNLDWNTNRDIVCGDRAFSFDCLQLHG
jgi:hypothetical protein